MITVQVCQQLASSANLEELPCGMQKCVQKVGNLGSPQRSELQKCSLPEIRVSGVEGEKKFLVAH